MRKKGCSGSLQTTLLGVDGQCPVILKRPSFHSHEPDTQRIVRGCTIAHLRSSIKAAPLVQLKALYDAEISGQHEVAAEKVFTPTYRSVETILEATASRRTFKLPKTCNDINPGWSVDRHSDGKILLHSPNVVNNNILVLQARRQS